MLAAVLALVLVAGIGAGAWAYFTGRLGFGPLSAADKDAAATIAAEAEGPQWADEQQLRCGADALVSERRSDALADSGLIERDGDDWTYTGEWDDDDAAVFMEAVLDCSDDWQAQLGEEWGLDDTDCLADVGSAPVADYLAADTFELGDGATSAADDAVEKLDECYAEDVTAPEGKADPGYRAVTFTFTETEVANADVEVVVAQGGKTRTLAGTSYCAATDEGGEKVCVTATVTATYAWGSTREDEAESCGQAKPKELVWRKLKSCAQPDSAPCNSWELRYEGFASYSAVTVTLKQNGGDCDSVSGDCTFTVTTPATGRGTVVTWSAPLNWTERFTAEGEDLTAVLPN